MRIVKNADRNTRYQDAPVSDEEFHQLSQFIYNRCGIQINNRKRTMLEARLRRRLQETGISTYEEYCKFLFDKTKLESEEEAVSLIDAVTVNKTDFFREPSHFTFLVQHVIPALRTNGKKNFKIWSAASSNGCEPYTIAMVMSDFLESYPETDFFILGTDICTNVLEKAISARYTESQIAPIPAADKRRHLLRSKDKNSLEYRMAPHLRSKVAFLQLNLFNDHYPISFDYDVIFCRNVLIYFNKTTQKRILLQLIKHLQPDGYLILGHSESTVGMDLPLISVANTIFRLHK